MSGPCSIPYSSIKFTLKSYYVLEKVESHQWLLELPQERFEQDSGQVEIPAELVLKVDGLPSVDPRLDLPDNGHVRRSTEQSLRL